MASIWNFTTATEGWQLFSHYIGNCLAVFALSERSTSLPEEEVEENERARCDSWVKLVGSLSYVTARTRTLGFGDYANKMQTITESAATTDLNDPAMQEVIKDLHEGLSPTAKEFSETVKQLFGERGT